MKKYTSKALHPSASDLNHEAYKAGCALFRDGNFTKAKLAFEEALTYWPKDAQAWMALGNCQDELGKPERAEECLRRALQYGGDKDLDAIRFNLANSLLDQKRFVEAIELYQGIPSESDVFAKAQRNLSLAQRNLSLAKSSDAGMTPSKALKGRRTKRARP
jgi:Flp pilus assembly protein TadD